MGAAVEGHVLEHVRQAALIVGLVVRAGAHGQAQQDAVGRPRVAPDEVDEAVRQPAGRDGRVEGHRRLEILRRGHARAEAPRESQHQQ
jgi:hypothetical protein